MPYPWLRTNLQTKYEYNWIPFSWRNCCTQHLVKDVYCASHLTSTRRKSPKIDGSKTILTGNRSITNKQTKTDRGENKTSVQPRNFHSLKIDMFGCLHRFSVVKRHEVWGFSNNWWFIAVRFLKIHIGNRSVDNTKKERQSWKMDLKCANRICFLCNFVHMTYLCPFVGSSPGSLMNIGTQVTDPHEVWNVGMHALRKMLSNYVSWDQFWET